MEEQYMNEGPTSDWQSVINSVHYKSMKKLMALVDTKTYDTIEEFTKLAEYFPGMRNPYPEYHGITQAYVSAFNDTSTADERARKDLPPPINKQYMIKAMVSRLKKATTMDGKLVKHHAAAIAPIFVPEKEKKWSENELEALAEAFCVESCKTGRIRRVRRMFPKLEVKNIQSAKVAPCLFRSQTRKTQVRTAADIDRIATIFCVENEEQANKRRIKTETSTKKIERLDVKRPIYPHIGQLKDNYNRGDQLDNTENMYSNISNWMVLDSNVYIADLDDDGLGANSEVNKDTANNTEKNNGKNGKVARYMKSIRKMFKRSEK